MRTVLPHSSLFPRFFSELQVSGCRASRSCPFRHDSPTASRADAVKVGRRANLDADVAVDRPHLDGGEHDAMLEPDGRTWRLRPPRSMSTAMMARRMVQPHRKHTDQFGLRASACSKARWRDQHRPVREAGSRATNGTPAFRRSSLIRRLKAASA